MIQNGRRGSMVPRGILEVIFDSAIGFKQTMDKTGFD